MSEITAILWWEQNRWLAVAFSSSVAVHGALFAIAPAPAEQTKPPAPLIVRLEGSPAPAAHVALRQAHAASPPQRVQRPQKPLPQATASLRSDVDETPHRPPDPAPVALNAGGAPPAQQAERPMVVQVAALAATPAAAAAQSAVSIERVPPPSPSADPAAPASAAGGPAAAAGEKHAALDKVTPPPRGPSSSDESDQSPVAYLYTPAPNYPLEARRLHLEGQVLLHVRVDRAGEPREATIAQSSGVALLDQAALTGVRAWRFSAAKHGSTPVEHWVAVPIQFKLDGRHTD